MTAPVSHTPAARRSWGRIALVAALALSLLLNAVAVGAWLRLREARADLLGPEAAAARLPDDLRQDLRTALRAEARSIRPLLRDVVQARAAGRVWRVKDLAGILRYKHFQMLTLRHLLSLLRHRADGRYPEHIIR